MTRLGTLALIVVATASLLAGPSSAAPIKSLSTKFVSDLVSGKASANDINTLFNAVGLTATSVSGGSLGNFSFVKTFSTAAPAKQVDLVVLGGTYSLGLSLGKKNEILSIRLQPIRPTPPSTRPIPEARTILLYALGFLAVGWTVIRSRAARHSAAPFVPAR